MEKAGDEISTNRYKSGYTLGQLKDRYDIADLKQILPVISQL